MAPPARIPEKGQELPGRGRRDAGQDEEQRRPGVGRFAEEVQRHRRIARMVADPVGDDPGEGGRGRGCHLPGHLDRRAGDCQGAAVAGRDEVGDGPAKVGVGCPGAFPAGGLEGVDDILAKAVEPVAALGEEPQRRIVRRFPLTGNGSGSLLTPVPDRF